MTKSIFKTFFLSLIFWIWFFITLIISLKVRASVSTATPGSTLSASNRNELLTHVFQKNWNDLYYLTGNIWIWTSSPSAKLSIWWWNLNTQKIELLWDWNHRIYLYNNQILWAQQWWVWLGWYLQQATNWNLTWIKSYAWFDSYNLLITNEVNKWFHFLKQSAWSTKTDWTISEFLTINTYWNVWIWTTNPSTKLHVEWWLILQSSNSTHRCLIQPYYNATPWQCPSWYSLIGSESWISLCLDCNY